MPLFTSICRSLPRDGGAEPLIDIEILHPGDDDKRPGTCFQLKSGISTETHWGCRWTKASLVRWKGFKSFRMALVSLLSSTTLLARTYTSSSSLEWHSRLEGRTSERLFHNSFAYLWALHATTYWNLLFTWKPRHGRSSTSTAQLIRAPLEMDSA